MGLEERPCIMIFHTNNSIIINGFHSERTNVMKRIAIIVLCLALIITNNAFSYFAEEDKTVFLTESFENYPTNSIPTVGKFTPEVYVAETGKLNKVLSVPLTSTSSYVTYNLDNIKSAFVYSFDVLINTDNIKGSVNFISSDNIKMNLITYDDAMYTYDNRKIGGLKSSNYVNLAIVYNPVEYVYSVYLEGNLILSEWYVDKNAISVVSSVEVSFSSDEDTDTELLIDNVFSYSGKTLRNISSNKDYNTKIVDAKQNNEGAEESEIFGERLFESAFNAKSDLSSLVLLEKGNTITIEKDSKNNNYLSVTRTTPADGFRFVIPFSGNSRYVVAEADIFGSGMSANLFGSRYNEVSTPNYIIAVGDNGEISSNGHVFAKLSKRVPVNIAVCMDYKNMTYSVYINKALVLKEAKFKNPMDGYGNNLYFYFNPTTKLGNIGFDNIKIYTGKTPDDYPKDGNSGTIDINNELFGAVSPYIDLRTGAIQKLENVNILHISGESMYSGKEKIKIDNSAFIENGVTYVTEEVASKLLGQTITVSDGESGFKEKNGKRFIPIANYAREKFGKTVKWEELGMVIIGDSHFESSQSDLLDINSFMLYDRPTTAEIKSRMSEASGKRLILTDEILKRMAERANDPAYNQLCEKFIKIADIKMDTTCENYTTSYFDRLKTLSQDAVKRVPTVMLAYFLTGDNKYSDYAISEALYICNEFTDWKCGSQGLITAHLAATVALTYNWLYDKLTPEEKTLMEETMYNQAVSPMFSSFHKRAGRDDVGLDNNRTMITSGGIAIAAMAIYDQYPDICANIIANTILNHEIPLLTMYPSGIWYEGLEYTEYTFSNVCLFLSALDSMFGTDFNLTKTPGFDKLAVTTKQIFGPSGCINFGDCTESTNFSATWLSWYASVFKQPIVLAERNYQLKKGTVSSFDILFYEKNNNAEPIPTSEDLYLAKDEIVLLKDGSEGYGDNFVAMKSGYTHKSHGHLDSGSFIIDLMGERFASDLGKGDYSWKGYQSPSPSTKYQYYLANAEGHNTLVINPDGGYQQNIGDESFYNVFDGFEKVESKAKGAFAITQLTNAYSKNATSVRRGVMLADERQSVVIRDEIDLIKSGSDVYWFMHIKNGDITIQDNNTAYITVNGKKAKFTLLTNAPEYELSKSAAMPLETSPTPLSNEGNREEFQKITIKLKASGRLNITVKLEPVTTPCNISPINNIPLDNWHIEDGEIIRYKSYPDKVYINGKAFEEFNINEYLYEVESDDELTITADVADYLEYKVEGNVLRLYYKGKPEIIKEYVFKRNMKLFTGDVSDLSKYKIANVEFSDQQSSQNNFASNAFDGDFSTRWSAEGEQWLTADLGEEKVIDAVGISTLKGGERFLTFKILCSNDNMNWKEVFVGRTDTANGDEFNYIDMKSIKARYVRCYGYGTNISKWNSILEFAVFGKEQ